MKLLTKIAAVAGLAFASIAPASAAVTFNLSGGSVSSSVVGDPICIGCTITGGVTGGSTTLNVGETGIVGSVDLFLTGLGIADADVFAFLDFDTPTGDVNGTGSGEYFKIGRLVGGYLNWDNPFTASGTTSTGSFATYEINIANLSGLQIGRTISAPISVTLVSEVPEPATWAMLLVGFGVVGAALRRRPARIAQAV